MSAIVPPPATVAPPVIVTGASRRRWYKIPSLVGGLSLLGLLLLAAILAPWLTPFGPTQQFVGDVLAPPSRDHWLGTDHLGRDVFTRVLHAARIDLRVGLTAVIPPFVIGSTLGLVAGYFGGLVGSAIMRAADVVMAFPYYVLVIALVFVIGPGVGGIYLAVALVVWSSYARIVHGEVLSAKRSDYVLAARAAGLGHFRVMRRHVLPNTISQAVVYSTSDAVVIILGVVTLSFLGLGVPPPTPEWGSMISDARPFITASPHLVIAPGLAVVITGLSLSLIGDGLARALRRERS